MVQNLQELQQRCQQITGKTIGDLAAQLQIAVPNNLLHAKGWIGQLIEQYLGASGGSNAIHDFPDLGIELKTIPITAKFQALESTYVCTVQSNEASSTWRDSWVYRKLSKVLWVPILSADLPINARIIQSPVLWCMEPAIEDALRTDWEELMEMLQLGYGKDLSAKFGQYLHIRPKAAHSKILVDYIDQHGNPTKIVPKGFYLRTAFTNKILSA